VNPDPNTFIVKLGLPIAAVIGVIDVIVPPTGLIVKVRGSDVPDSWDTVIRADPEVTKSDDGTTAVKVPDETYEVDKGDEFQ
jgi:hypothetical protein